MQCLYAYIYTMNKQIYQWKPDCNRQRSLMPAKSTWNTQQFTLHLISFIPFMKNHKRSAKESAS